MFSYNFSFLFQYYNRDLLETELADEISTLKSSLIGKTFRAKNTKNLPTIKVFTYIIIIMT